MLLILQGLLKNIFVNVKLHKRWEYTIQPIFLLPTYNLYSIIKTPVRLQSTAFGSKIKKKHYSQLFTKEVVCRNPLYHYLSILRWKCINVFVFHVSIVILRWSPGPDLAEHTPHCGMLCRRTRKWSSYYALIFIYFFNHYWR